MGSSSSFCLLELLAQSYTALTHTKTSTQPNQNRELQRPETMPFIDFTGRELHPGKRGVIKIDKPKALRKLGLDKNH